MVHTELLAECTSTYPSTTIYVSWRGFT
jgi:hypothetical protein